MRGHTYRNAIAENISNLRPMADFRRWASTRKKLCWKCQQDKPPQGGSITMIGPIGGIQKFICKDCIDAKQKQLREANEDDSAR